MNATLNLTFALLLAAARNFRRVVPAEVVVLAVEEDYELGRTLEANQRFTRRALWREVAGNGRFRSYTVEALAEAKTFERVAEIILDAFNGSEGFHAHAVVTQEEADRLKSEKERRRLEAIASGIARRHGVEVSSLAFIAACEEELRRFSDYRAGLREDGLCIGFGVTAEQWQDEFNASGGDSATVSDVLDWLRSECPLLFAKHEEAKLQAAREGAAE
jgi:hypothetical protein